ncbi:hypothetical protein [Streptomyces sp. NPDC029004]|uniref:hypothetical protein n=1 Tax=Streptomyces sp. NPDC029004 TaxID=3154490 RepID=UPI0034093412
MPTHFEQRMRNLLVARSTSALSLSASFAAIADPTSEFARAPRAWPMVQGQIRYLERLTTAVLRQGGVPWDALAGFYGVSKQALHRRLAADVDEVIARSDQYREVHESDLVINHEIFSNAARTTIEVLDRQLDETSQIWASRRRQGRWWDPDGTS